jgi:predicted RNA-binding protein
VSMGGSASWRATCVLINRSPHYHVVAHVTARLRRGCDRVSEEKEWVQRPLVAQDECCAEQSEVLALRTLPLRQRGCEMTNIRYVN